MEEVRRIRKERGLTQDQLAELADVDQANLSLIETGRRKPTLDTLEKKADALDVEVADFLPRAQPDLFSAVQERLAQLDFAAMSRATPAKRRRALREATDDEVSEYRRSIDRSLDNLKKWKTGEEGYIEQDQETLAKQEAFLLALRAETDPFDVVPPSKEQRAALAAHASVATAGTV